MYNLAPNQENNITDQGIIYQNNKLVNKVLQQVISGELATTCKVYFVLYQNNEDILPGF